MQAAFIEGPKGALFAVFHLPDPGVRVEGVVLCAQAFAEEQNKSRRMVNLQARALARAGWVVMIPDLRGCGDSSGDFGDADWQGWLDDLRACVTHLQQVYSASPIVFWGVRTGCLLLSQLTQQLEAPKPVTTVFWQPVVDGNLVLMQFLRLRVAAGMMGGSKETTKDLRARLEAGESIEIAGYMLSPSLAAGLAQSQLKAPRAGLVHWFDVVPSEDVGLAAQSQKRIDEWRRLGVTVNATTCKGEPFWSTQEIREVPRLIELTQAAVAQGEAVIPV